MYRCLMALGLALGAGWSWGQGVATLGGTYQRFGCISINTHGARIPPQLLHFINKEGNMLLIKNRAIGITVPKGFYFKIDFLPDFNSYQRYSVAVGNGPVGPGTLGYTVSTVRQKANGNKAKPPQMPVEIVCYWKADEPWEIVPTLLHEMNHAVHAADYGMMPTWLQEGMSEWFANRKQHLGVDKKIARLNQYRRYMNVVDKMDLDQFFDFVAATTYDEWEKHVGDVGMCYFLAETLVDFFIGNVSAQPYFRGALQKAKLSSDWQYERTLILAKNIQDNWPGGEAMLLKGWKSWYKLQAKPKPSNELEPFLDANRRRFHELVKEVRAKKVVADADRYALVSQWLAFKRLEMDDLNTKLGESYHRSENILLRSRQWHVQQFSTQDHNQRSAVTIARRNHLRKTQPNLKDPLYKRTLPCQSLVWYLNLDPGNGAHPRPAYLGTTKLPAPNFRWNGLDAWQANMIFTNLFTSHIGKPENLPAPKLKATATGPYTQALRANNLNANAALKSIGGKIERDAVTGQVTLLNLARTRVDNADLEHLALLYQPRALDLSDTDITDAAWPHLSGWSSLRQLNLRRTRVSADMVTELKHFAPGLEIQ